MTKLAYCGLGANLEQPIEQINFALRALATSDGIQVLRCSSFYGSTAVGPGEQPDYVNAVAELTSELSAAELLQRFHQIEADCGRQRTLRWGPRTLDLDLLWYDNQQSERADLLLPHPRIRERNFVLWPWRELNPDLDICGLGRVDSLASRVSGDGLWRLPAQTRAADKQKKGETP
ncbi:2-amino-4-hydroxy-6-hydroxymethyldihydropteridine diphosphokinase [Agaribacterium haliotis]|uniref:2-amino-4-hydroxy-6- hydroxymethyldihydropteridine diphosphokinase n=1 Tax=Agaribacterium haliotis TaxID=2013869 RepID=UPI000BB57079|nr:2-amino-4-hydroxy-6-hydroxymethyldihydropteridine diphosphokinase [Agaribacterium haliotis]